MPRDNDTESDASADRTDANTDRTPADATAEDDAPPDVRETPDASPDQSGGGGQTTAAQTNGRGGTGGGADFDLDDTMQDEGVQEVEVRGLGTAQAKLLSYGSLEQFQRQNAGGGTGMGITAADMAQILNDHYEDPDFASVNGGRGLTGDDVKGMKPAVPGALLDAIAADDMDVQMNDDGSAHVDTAGNSAGR